MTTIPIQKYLPAVPSGSTEAALDVSPYRELLEEATASITKIVDQGVAATIFARDESRRGSFEIVISASPLLDAASSTRRRSLDIEVTGEPTHVRRKGDSKSPPIDWTRWRELRGKPRAELGPAETRALEHLDELVRQVDLQEEVESSRALSSLRHMHETHLESLRQLITRVSVLVARLEKGKRAQQK